jgi:hypothetical protein
LVRKSIQTLCVAESLKFCWSDEGLFYFVPFKLSPLGLHSKMHPVIDLSLSITLQHRK